MAVFTNVSDDVLEPGDPIRSVDILAIKENTNFNREFLDIQTFDANGTWTKPLSGGVVVGRLARIQVWGGGGGGARQTGNVAATGGGGAGYNEIYIALSTLGATVTVTIGAGGAGRTGGSAGGGVGGQTSFGAVISSFGGGGGIATEAEVMYAGGGGPMSAGGARAGLKTAESTLAYGDPKPNSTGTGEITQASAFQTLWHGGSAYSTNIFGFAINGSPGLFGGAGGGSARGTVDTSGGTSLHGGNGGNGGRSTTGIDGVQPGGGGGGRNGNLNGGNGAAGRVIVTVW